jgi:hypothetical protein
MNVPNNQFHKSEVLGTMKNKNFQMIEFCAMLLHTQKEEGEEYVGGKIV